MPLGEEEFMPKLAVSDTVHVTADGRTVVDVRKLFNKQHMREAIRQMRAKTRIVPRKHSSFGKTPEPCPD
jgi:hypothetical protein